MFNSTQYKKYDSYFRNINVTDNLSPAIPNIENKIMNEYGSNKFKLKDPSTHFFERKKTPCNYSDRVIDNGINNNHHLIPTTTPSNLRNLHYEPIKIKSVRPDYDFLEDNNNSPLKKYEDNIPALETNYGDFGGSPKFNSKNSELFIYDFKIIRQITKVNFCDLYSVNHKGTIKHIQLIPKSNLHSNKNSVEMLKYLVNQAAKMNHPSLLNIENFYSNKTEIYILGEKLPSLHLADYLTFDWPNEAQTKQIMRGVFEGLFFLHSNGILHKNLTLSSIFVEPKSLQIKIAFYSYPDILNLINLPLEYNSIPFYNSPEKILNFEYVPGSDIWVAGLILLLLLTKEIPFQSNDLDYLMKEMKNFDIVNFLKLYSKNNKTISSEAQDLLIKLMKRIPNERLNAKEALTHRWFDSLCYLNYMPSLNDKSRFLSEWIFQRSITNYVSSYIKINEYLDQFNLDISKISNLNISELPNLIENNFGKMFKLDEGLLESKDKTIQDLINIICTIFFKIKIEYSEAELKKTFKEYDKNNDGFINVYEISKGNYAFQAKIEKIIDNYSQGSTQIDFNEMKKILEYSLVRKNYVSQLKLFSFKSQSSIR